MTVRNAGPIDAARGPVPSWLQPPQVASLGIPRIIHQTFSHRSRLPAVLADNCRAIAALNPDFDYRFYEDDDRQAFIRQAYGDAILSRYLKIHPSYGAARADLFRYLCLYIHGGVYLDVKVQVKQPLASVIKPDDAYILGQWDQSPGSRYRGWGTHQSLQDVPGGEYQQWHIMASPRHPYLAAVIAAVIDKIDTYNPFENPHPWDAVMQTTGPVIYTRSIHAIREAHPHRLVSNMEALGIGYSIFDASETPDAHRRLYRDYRSSDVPLIQQPFPLSWLFSLRAAVRRLARRIRSSLRP